MKAFARLLLTVFLLGFMSHAALALDIVVRDARSGLAVPQATVLIASQEFRCDDQGHLVIPATTDGTPMAARATGYARFSGSTGTAPMVIALQPLRPKALYLSAYGIGSATLRGDALKLAAETELNALVVDVKGDRGIVPYPSAAVAAAGLTQSVVTVRDMPALVRDLKARGLYLIARIVTFKDDPYAMAHPAWAVHDAHGNVWKDREGLAWIDPFRREAWERSFALAAEAAALGFDEIQFDYLRFPDSTGLVFAEPDTQDRRVATIGEFLQAARERLARHNVFIAADVFGYVTWNKDDTHIGQHLESIVKHVDYLSPMLYPSGFSFGIPGYRDPLAAPYEIVYRSLRRAMERTGLPGTRIRPWLQAFRDYAFDRRSFGEREIRLQIDAADALGTDGWMLWNAGNRYQRDGLDEDNESSP